VKKSVWIIFFSLVVVCSSCSTIRRNVTIDDKKWKLPSRKSPKSVEFIPITEVENPTTGYYLSSEQAISLTENVEELKAYTKKLELLISKMEEYYNRRDVEK